MTTEISQVLQQTIKDVSIELSDLFDKNFEKKSFFASAWKRERVDPGRGSLMMRTGTLRRSIRSRIAGNMIEWYSEHPAAAIHNEGGQITVTAKMKRFFWAKYYEATGGLRTTKAGNPSKSRAIIKHNTTKTTLAEQYKALALKKVGDKIVIPKREFLGYAPEVETAIREIITRNLEQYFDKIEFVKK